ncbi:MAG: hypothetical protein COU09_01520 [Candidatus Harrisonbacteria bacterium CG10_big_fil_rev_8_21_14_0_10_44_23]|uniref:Baseplate protein J-like domain-containing protein n=1 Tax=Candidatus Harrisonbacteria bacterium CG10_big_fil_rev_8_21_14_0_10_44_23 TaxID=1974585 RepID=A0A2H0UQ91_9BACT|nr:MAG: hypothetical protein COU09_01520 [Candidatus Harrisonbacteria bacterium CG10_big_fil_rev_8_21_14_0_10_44_23]
MAKDKSIEKIAVNKNDEPTAIAERLIDSDADSIILSIPKFSKFAESVSNFKLLKRESDILDKEVIVETVDEDALALAKESGLEAHNPFFGRMKGGQQISDIRTKATKEQEAEEEPKPKKKKATKAKKKPEVEEAESEAEEEVEEEETPEAKEEGRMVEIKLGRTGMGVVSDVLINDKPVAPTPPPAEPEPGLIQDIPTPRATGRISINPVNSGIVLPEEEATAAVSPYSPSPEPERLEDHHPENIFKHLGSDEGIKVFEKIKKYKGGGKLHIGGKKRKLILVGVVILLVLIPYLALAVLPKAEILVETGKTPWDYSGTVAALSSATQISAENTTIPGQIFTQTTNLTLRFDANGRETIERKATGQIEIINAHSSESQPLVATTRFETPDGKIFRITEGVTVPGAEVKDGKIIPSSITANIVADKPGQEYNLASVEKLTVPGFKGDPKFSSFYGKITTPTEGGFVGEAKVATEEDVDKAVQEAKIKIQESSKALMMSKIPEGFKVLDGASEFEIKDQTVNREADAEGKFSVFSEAQISQFAFKEDQLEAMLAEKALVNFPGGNQVDSKKIEFGAVKPNFEDKILRVEVSYKSQIEKIIDASKLKESVLGKKEAALQETLSAVEGVKRAEVSLWPFWVKTVPSNGDKVKLEID